MGRAAVKKQLMQKFQPRMAQIRSLKSEIYQTVGQRGDVPFNPDHMKLVNAIPDTWTAAHADITRRLDGTAAGAATSYGSELTYQDMVGMLPKFEEGLGIFAGLIDQTRVCLDQIDFVGESFGKDMKIPYWAKSMVGGLDFVSELSDCMMRAGVNDVKKMMCPMKYASAFSDFMSGLDNMMGMSNSNMGMMGDSASGGGVADTGFDASNLATDVTDATGWGVATTIAPTTV